MYAVKFWRCGENTLIPVFFTGTVSPPLLPGIDTSAVEDCDDDDAECTDVQWMDTT